MLWVGLAGGLGLLWVGGAWLGWLLAWEGLVLGVGGAAGLGVARGGGWCLVVVGGLGWVLGTLL